MAKKKTTRKNTPTKNVNKAQAIRDYLASHPNTSAAEVADELGKQGIQVSANYVSNVKSTTKKSVKKKRAPTKKRTPAKKPQPPASAFDDVKEAGSLMYQALDLVLKAGVREARSMVDMADKMINRISDEESK